MRYRLRLCFLVGLSALPILPAAARVDGASNGIAGVLEAELQRNFRVLSTQPVPAYFIGCTVHDERDTSIAASKGALLRSDERRGRTGSVEVRVGDYSLDSTHPIRGDSGGVGPRVARATLPLTDEEKPI